MRGTEGKRVSRSLESVRVDFDVPPFQRRRVRCCGRRDGAGCARCRCVAGGCWLTDRACLREWVRMVVVVVKYSRSRRVVHWVGDWQHHSGGQPTTLAIRRYGMWRGVVIHRQDV